MTADAGCRKGLEHGLALADCTNDGPPLRGDAAEHLQSHVDREGSSIGWPASWACVSGHRLRASAEARHGRPRQRRPRSAHKPCLIILEHKPARIAAAAKGVKLALVGKTITYDTGGYSLKISNGMKGMKYDK